jgi:hypothetical protein
MEQHGPLALDPTGKQQWLGISAATIDRLLSSTREQASGGRKRRSGVGSAIRRSVPIRTFADGKAPRPATLRPTGWSIAAGPCFDTSAGRQLRAQLGAH